MLKVLLVEDEGLTRWTMRRALERAGYAVEEAETCLAANDQLLRQPFDVVILDYRLPDGTGLDVARELRRRDGRQVVAFLTAESDRISEDEIKALAIARVFGKPANSEELCVWLSQQGEMTARPEEKVIGRFRLCVPGVDMGGVVAPQSKDDWLALDMIGTVPSADGIQKLRDLAASAAAAGARLCLIGATPGLVAAIKESGVVGTVDMVQDRREVESLNRRLCANSERRSVLEAAVRRVTT
jgi:CheY-like chemotaxis protein